MVGGFSRGESGDHLRRSVAYIRRSSKSRSDPGDISREFQTETVRSLAGGDANLVILDGDWGKSASADAIDKRLVFLELLASIERGEVDTLYAYATDRLARSVRWSAQLLDVCEAAGTTIVTSEGRFAPGDDMARQMFHFTAVTNETYSRQAKRKRRSTVERQRARGAKCGSPYYGSQTGESVATVRRVFDETGSLSATARELNRLGLPSRRGHWAHSSVQRILAREGVVPAVGVKGAKHRHPHLFARLLRCHCGHLLTGSRRSDGSTIYRCLRAETSFDHERKSVAEAIVLRWAEIEMRRLVPPTEPVALTDLEAERHALTARLERIRVAFLDGLLDEDRMRAENAEANDALTRLELQSQAVQVPPFSWNHPAGAVNLALRALWRHVQLGPDLRPLHAEWLVPDSWLAPRERESPAAQDH